MFERYTEKARRVIFYARFEASEFGTPAIEAECLLLALLREDKVHLDLFLPSADSERSIRAQIEARTPRSKKIPASVDLPLSEECKRILSYAADEAENLHHKHIGTEHLYLAVLREESCFAAQILRERGADLEGARKALANSHPQPPSAQQEADARASLGRMIEQSGLWGPPQTGQAAEVPAPARSAPTGNVPFERYTENARRAVFFARNEASEFGSPYIESEHLLLGLMRAGSDHLALFFPAPEAQESVRKQVEAHTFIREKVSTSVDLPLSNECKRALAYGAEEAERLAKKFIRVEHLLLGLLREEGCFAARILREHGAEPNRIRIALANPPQET
jgi:ATP-dependent Clp protease ATP-binding subunit ClpA